MSMSLLDTLAASSREPSTVAQPLAFTELVFGRVRVALERRRLRRAVACLDLNDHLRRDVGLPPLNGRRW